MFAKCFIYSIWAAVAQAVEQVVLDKYSLYLATATDLSSQLPYVPCYQIIRNTKVELRVKCIVMIASSMKVKTFCLTCWLVLESAV